jgi:hypothetical protein
MYDFIDVNSRDRNREHAKNTRLRKKAYVMKLKELVDQMKSQKETEEKERRALGERIYDTVRTVYHVEICTNVYLPLMRMHFVRIFCYVLERHHPIQYHLSSLTASNCL